jgi:hypothetical protein
VKVFVDFDISGQKDEAAALRVNRGVTHAAGTEGDIP